MTNQKPTNPHELTASVCYDLVSRFGDLEIELIMSIIKNDGYEKQITQIRNLVKEGRKQEANELKKELPAATFSCRYAKRRCAQNVTGYTGVIVLDADNLSPSDLVRIVAMLPCCRYTYGFFISPSGNGIKILVKTNGSKENHRHTYLAVMDYYASLLGISFDSHCSDICRLTFFSCDAQAYLNAEADVYDASKLVPVQEVKRKRVAVPLYIMDTQYNLFSECVKSTRRYINFEEGSRNNFCYRLARRCKLRGISEAEAMEKILDHFDYNQKEVVATVRSAFRRN